MFLVAFLKNTLITSDRSLEYIINKGKYKYNDYH